MDRAAAAAVRNPVMCSPSISARQAPVVASKTAITAGCGSSPSATLPANTPTSLTTTGLSNRRPLIVRNAPPSAGIDWRGGAGERTGGNGL